MIELYKNNNELNGSVSSLKFEVAREEDGLVVKFVNTYQGADNQWHNPKVITDIYVDIYHLLDEYSRAEDVTEIEKYILDHKEESFDVLYGMRELCKSEDHIIISLPTSKLFKEFCGHGEWPTQMTMRKEIFPLFVYAKGKDISTDFFDFNVFGDKAVKIAYEALIEGKIPDMSDQYVDFSGVQKLHEELFSSKEDMLP